MIIIQDATEDETEDDNEENGRIRKKKKLSVEKISTCLPITSFDGSFWLWRWGVEVKVNVR